MTKRSKTPNQRSHDELERRCEELQLIVDAIPALVFHKDTKNRILRVNRAAAEALGVGEDHFPESDAGEWYSEQTDAYYKHDLEVIRSGEPKLGVLEVLTVPGRAKRWLKTSRLPQFENGSVSGILVVSQDITAKRELEERLIHGQKLESIGRLAGGVAHDFNNLLTTIFGLVSVAQRSLPTDSMAHEYLALLRLAAEGGANLTKQLLTFARRQLIEPRVIDLNALVLETSHLLQRALNENIDVHLELSGGTLPVKVDPNQFSQLLLNLALNARDAMIDGGRLTFRTAQTELTGAEPWSMSEITAGRYATLSVQDTGKGFSEEAKEHLFEPFFTTKDRGKGTGLGLAMCYGIVKQSGGHIAVHSLPGQGTTFTIYLPEIQEKLDAPARKHRSGPVPAGNETLLFVEDDDLVRNLAVTALSSSGYRLIEASNGDEALKAAQEHRGPIHLLITDVIMPVMGGVELAQRFRQLRPEAGILYVSGYTGDALSEMDADVPLLQKPFTNDELLAHIRNLLDAQV